LSTFSLVAFAWIFFRANTVDDAFRIIQKIGRTSWSDPVLSKLNNHEMGFCALLIGLLLVKDKWLPVIPTEHPVRSYVYLLLLIVVCYLFGTFNTNQFIYFQF
jgi:alginate O-acetyltransferase complex protein AlgI